MLTAHSLICYGEHMQIDDSQDIFAQLAQTDGAQGVKTIIENHDAWSNSEVVQAAVHTHIWGRMGLAKDPVRLAKVERQRAALRSLVVHPATRTLAAG